MTTDLSMPSHETPRGLYLAFPARVPFTIHCPRPGCAHKAEAETEGQAVRQLAQHLVHDHMPAPMEVA